MKNQRWISKMIIQWPPLVEIESRADGKWIPSHHPRNSNPRKVKVPFTSLPFILQPPSPHTLQALNCSLSDNYPILPPMFSNWHKFYSTVIHSYILQDWSSVLKTKNKPLFHKCKSNSTYHLGPVPKNREACDNRIRVGLIKQRWAPHRSYPEVSKG